MIRHVLRTGIGALLLAMLAVSASAEREVVDRIVAVVGDQVILASELASQVQIAAFQTKKNPRTEAEAQEFQRQILEQMISDQLFLIEAKKDTSIVIRREEVDQALEEQIARVASSFDSQEDFLAALAQEGMTLRDLERRYHDDIKNNLLRQRFIQKKLYSVSVSRHEVEQFYNEFRDSIPTQPEAVELAHILIDIKPSKELEDSVYNLATDLRQRVLDGADFATLASQYSSFGAGANGGDLGYIRRDDVDAEFARAAFKLNVGDVSGVIRTQFGYHVIKCEGKRSDQLRLRHILLGVQPSAADTAAAVALADSLMTVVREGGDFAELAKAYSSDDDSRAQGGALGWFALDQLPVDFAPTVVGWKTPGELRGPLKTKFGVHILKLLDYQPEKQLTLENDYDRIKELARQDKTGRIVDEWIQEIKEKTYIDYRMAEMKP